MRGTYLEPDWWNLDRDPRPRRPSAREIFSSEPPPALERDLWRQPAPRVQATTELGRGRRIPVRGERLRDEGSAHTSSPSSCGDPRTMVSSALGTEGGRAAGAPPEPDGAATAPEPPPSTPGNDERVAPLGRPSPTPAETRESAPGPSSPSAAVAGASWDDLGELKRQAREALADLTATRRRLEREGEKQRSAIRGELVAELLPVLDDLERSLGAAEGKTDASLLDGLALVRDGFLKALERLGAEPIAAEGEPFDPALHEALGVLPVADPALDGRVAKEWRRGYRLGNRVLRPAQVMVGRHAPE